LAFKPVHYKLRTNVNSGGYIMQNSRVVVNKLERMRNKVAVTCPKAQYQLLCGDCGKPSIYQSG
jgi:hypothetical protein